MKTIAERLIYARGAMSQQALAHACGVSQSTIGNIEAGLRKRPRDILSIARALSVSARWLETGEGYMTDAVEPAMDWPLELISRDQWLALSERQRGVVEAAAAKAFVGLYAQLMSAAKAPHLHSGATQRLPSAPEATPEPRKVQQIPLAGSRAGPSAKRTRAPRVSAKR